MKEEILQTSLKQFLQYGIREVSIQKLAEPLGISTKTVYKYFKNKEELLEEVLCLLTTQNFKEWENKRTTYNPVALFLGIWYTGVEAEYNINKVFYQDLLYYYSELHKKHEATLTRKYKKQFIRIIHKGMEEGFFLDSIIPEVAFDTISVLFRAIVREHQFKGFRLSSRDILLNTITVFIRGLCTENGLQLLEEFLQAREIKVRMITKERMVTSQT